MVLFVNKVRQDSIDYQKVNSAIGVHEAIIGLVLRQKSLIFLFLCCHQIS